MRTWNNNNENNNNNNNNNYKNNNYKNKNINKNKNNKNKSKNKNNKNKHKNNKNNNNKNKNKNNNNKNKYKNNKNNNNNIIIIIIIIIQYAYLKKVIILFVYQLFVKISLVIQNFTAKENSQVLNTKKLYHKITYKLSIFCIKVSKLDWKNSICYIQNQRPLSFLIKEEELVNGIEIPK